MTVDARWIECVPNVSAGRDLSTHEALLRVIEQFGRDAVVRLGDERDPDHHRAVFTLLVRPERLVDFGVAFASEVLSRIDLREHAGVHPRIGALDVFPMIPLAGVTEEETVDLATQLGEALGRECGLPSYLYESAARRRERRRLATIRRIGFERLTRRVAEGDAAVLPDLGPTALHERGGAVAIGVRFLLLAFNVDLESQDVALARSIAQEIRERDDRGLRGVRSLGLRLNQAGCVQVSMNLTDYRETGFDGVIQAVERLAGEAGVSIRRSELIGFTPYDAVIRALRGFEAAGEQLLDPGAWIDPQRVIRAFDERLRLSPSVGSRLLDVTIREALGRPLDLRPLTSGRLGL